MTNKEKRAAVVKKGLSRKGKNSYTQQSKRVYVGGYPTEGDNVKGYSDCSSFVRWCYKKICGVDIGYNTAAQIVNKKLIEVCGAKSGQPVDPSKMLPGDLLYYKGGNMSRPYQVGHVEMYIGNGKLLGHGSGTGPKEKSMKSYNVSRYAVKRGLIKVLRVIPLDESDTAPATPVPSSTLKVTASSLNVRTLPSTKGKILGVVKKGFILTPNGLTVDGWVGVTHAGNAAWVSARYVQEIAPGNPVEVKHTMTVTASRLNVRNLPGMNGKILGVVKRDTVLSPNGQTTEGWVGITYNGVAAWVSQKYVEVK